MKHIVSLSGGTASAIVADLVLKKYGRDNVILCFMDTSWEDEDLYRFLDDLESYWEIEMVKLKDGRTPLQVGEDQKFILNSRVKACSKILKQQMFRRFIKKIDKPLTIHLGLDWSEEHRMAAPKKNYEKIKGVTVDYPLIWKPLIKKKYSEVVESWGIEIPRLYKLGFPHNNCGGRCIAQGKKEWKRLLNIFPERYKEVSDWEQKMRKNLDTAKDKSIVKGITLKELAKEKKDQLHMFEGTAEDSFGCFCDY
tara:strand:- start:175 stop:930 length:756 start_codon:yes stop_codon:yes gene_type:complete